MTTKAELLAKAIGEIETNINIVESLVAESLTSADFSFVDDFRDARGGSLNEASIVLAAYAKRMSDNIATLANVLYVREMESMAPPSDWREWVAEGKKVEAIRSLREWTGSDKLSLKEAIDVIDTYKKTPF